MPINSIVTFYRAKEWFYHLGLTVLGFIFITGKPACDLSIVRALLISATALAYGYSFNKNCDKPFKAWTKSELYLITIPLVAGLILAVYFYYNFFLLLLLGVILNTLYSVPNIYWKKSTILSTVINVYIFGLLFLFGAYAAEKSYKLNTILTSFYIGGFFVPAQLLHEVSHARADGKKLFIKAKFNSFFIAIVCSILFLILFSIILYIKFNFKSTFLLANFLWVIFLLYLHKARIGGDDSFFKKSIKLRRLFWYLGILFGFFYLFSFLKI